MSWGLRGKKWANVTRSVLVFNAAFYCAASRYVILLQQIFRASFQNFSNHNLFTQRPSDGPAATRLWNTLSSDINSVETLLHSKYFLGNNSRDSQIALQWLHSVGEAPSGLSHCPLLTTGPWSMFVMTLGALPGHPGTCCAWCSRPWNDKIIVQNSNLNSWMSSDILRGELCNICTRRTIRLQEIRID